MRFITDLFNGNACGIVAAQKSSRFQCTIFGCKNVDFNNKKNLRDKVLKVLSTYDNLFRRSYRHNHRHHRTPTFCPSNNACSCTEILCIAFPHPCSPEIRHCCPYTGPFHRKHIRAVCKFYRRRTWTRSPSIESLRDAVHSRHNSAHRRYADNHSDHHTCSCAQCKFHCHCNDTKSVVYIAWNLYAGTIFLKIWRKTVTSIRTTIIFIGFIRTVGLTVAYQRRTDAYVFGTFKIFRIDTQGHGVKVVAIR